MSERPAPEGRIYSVGEFTRRMAGLFLRVPSLQSVGISGEVSGLREFNGHLGFTLKEERAVLDCVAWADARRTFPKIANGIAVVAVGRIGIRPDRSGYQLIVESIEPTGRGALYLMCERLREKFRAEGLFASERKRALPALPQRVALVSARGRGMEDFSDTLRRRAPFVAIAFVETQVQGQGAEIEIADAIDRASRLDVDVIVVTRGGGSYEDLFPFNLEPVVRAVVRARHPVLTAIGHSGDHHLADDAADLSLGTPSLAAEHIARGWSWAAQRLSSANRDLSRAAGDIVLQAAQRADVLAMKLQHGGAAFLASKRATMLEWERRLDRRSPQRAVADRRERLITLGARIETNAVRFLSEAYRRVERASGRLDGLNPLAPLARGYAIVTKDSVAVRDAALLHSGDRIEARFERGTAGACVESVRADG